MAKLILIDDDEELASSLKFALEENDWRVEVAHTGRDGLQLLKSFSYDAILLDWHLPDMTGLQVCKQFRAQAGVTPIVFLTGANGLDNKEAGLDMGADDYITKPFEMRELLARLRSVLRRASNAANLYTCGGVVLEPKLKELQYKNQTVRLSATEFSLIELFFRCPNQLLSAKEIFEKVWTSDADAQDGTVRVHMHTLRRKCEQAGLPEIIETVRGAGYILRSDDQRANS